MRLTLAIVLLCAGVLAAPVRAEVFERDLVPGSGDGLLTFDDVSQREWLDVTETFTREFPGGFGGVTGELGAGGRFEGFTLADREDVIELALSAGIDPNTSDPEINRTAAINLIGLMNRPTSISAAFIDEISAEDGERVVSLLAGSTRGSTAGLSFATRTSSPGGVGDTLLPVTGVMLFRQIPEPEAIGLFVSGGCVFLVPRRPRLTFITSK